MKHLNVLSLFDGMSCGRLAMKKSGIPVGYYGASEIDKWAIMVSQYNFPDINQIGDVCDLDPYDFGHIDIVMGGSPCQSMSVAGKGKGMTTNDGHIVDSLPRYLFFKNSGYNYDKDSSRYFHTSCIFWEYVRIYQGIRLQNPNVKFLLENVVNKEWGELITRVMGVEPIRINSSIASAQNRDRNYWTDIEYTPIPDNSVTLDSIIPDAIAGAGSRGNPQKNWVKTPENPYYHKQKTTVRPDGLANCLTKSGGKICRKYLSTDGDIKDINIEQAEQLQTVTVGYTDVPGVSDSQRFQMLGNGWTIDVIAHFFTCLKLEIEREERVLV